MHVLDLWHAKVTPVHLSAYFLGRGTANVASQRDLGEGVTLMHFRADGVVVLGADVLAPKSTRGR